MPVCVNSQIRTNLFRAICVCFFLCPAMRLDCHRSFLVKSTYFRAIIQSFKTNLDCSDQVLSLHRVFAVNKQLEAFEFAIGRIG